MDHLVLRRLASVALGGCAPGSAVAHELCSAGGGSEQAFLVVLVVVLLGGALFYAKGIASLWRRAGAGRGVRRRETLSFVLGWAALAASLLSPLDEWAESSFAVHMVQHELLMVVAAPLIVLGRPLEAWTWAASPALRRLFAGAMKAPALRQIGYVVTLSLGAWVLHAAALWLWHLPLLFEAALRSLPTHVVQHACFFASALAYWWTVFGGRSRHPKGVSIASLFTTMLHTSALGALLTFAPSPWYAAGPVRAFGLSPLEDQQLGGLIMWVPGGLAYMIPGLLIVRRWLAPPHPPARPVAAAAITAAE